MTMKGRSINRSGLPLFHPEWALLARSSPMWSAASDP